MITTTRGCSHCRRQLPSEKFYRGYDFPLDVVWLCPPCHKAADTALAEAP